MFGRDILDGGEKELQSLKKLVQNRDQLEKNLKILDDQEKEANRQLAKKKKEIEKSISVNEREEREKAAAPFIGEINVLEKKKKGTLEELTSVRKAKIEEEIKEQTNGWQDIKQDHKKRIKQLVQGIRFHILERWQQTGCHKHLPDYCRCFFPHIHFN